MEVLALDDVELGLDVIGDRAVAVDLPDAREKVQIGQEPRRGDAVIERFGVRRVIVHP
jgi:hypothetical protein